MGTRSTINYFDPRDNLIHGIYCNWDGYLSHNGKILATYYKDLRRIRRLVALGSISSLGKFIRPEDGQFPMARRHIVTYPKGWEKSFKNHSYDCPAQDVVVAYHRDRKDAWDETTKPYAVGNIDHIPGQEYDYFYKHGHWFYRDRASMNNVRPYIPLPKFEVPEPVSV